MWTVEVNKPFQNWLFHYWFGYKLLSGKVQETCTVIFCELYIRTDVTALNFQESYNEVLSKCLHEYRTILQNLIWKTPPKSWLLYPELSSLPVRFNSEYSLHILGSFSTMYQLQSITAYKFKCFVTVVSECGMFIDIYWHSRPWG